MKTIMPQRINDLADSSSLANEATQTSGLQRFVSSFEPLEIALDILAIGIFCAAVYLIVI